MVRAAEGGDLEAIPVEVADVEPSPPRAHRPRRARRHRIGPVPAIGVVVLVGVVAGGLLLGHRSRPAPRGRAVPAPPTLEEINARPAVQHSSIITVWGSKILAGSVTGSTVIGPIGFIDPTPTEGRTGVVGVTGPFVLAQGTDPGGDGRTGTWAYPPPAPGRAGGPGVFLGTSTGFCPAPDGAWLTDGATVRHVSAADAAMLDGPFPLDGRLVASVGGGLLLQRGAQVVWWVPGTPGESRLVGTGTALAGLGESILWQAASGRIEVTDPNTALVTATAVTVWPGQVIGAAAMSPGLVRVAVERAGTLSIGDAHQEGRQITVPGGPFGEVAFLDDNTLLARVGDRGVAVIDAASGVTVREPDLGFASRGLALLPPG